jgi:GNAT superfamily N-acetyltransferase
MASEREAPACLALMPKAAGARAELLIARADGEFAGAGAVFWVNGADPPGFHVLVSVLPPARRRGVGRALIEAAANLADGETDGLWSLEAATAESAAAKFLEACGFTPRKREYYYEVGVDPLLKEVEDIAGRLRARHRIPERAEALYLSEPSAPLDEIAWLVAREFNGVPTINLRSLARRREDEADGPVFVRLDGELISAMLCRKQDGMAYVDVRVVSKRWRNNWPNLVMLEKALRWGRGEALPHARFFCDESVHDTINLARRGDGVEVDVKTRYRLALVRD